MQNIRKIVLWACAMMLSVCAGIFCTGTGYAAESRTIYVKPDAQNFVWHDSPLYVRLLPDEAQCRKAYGKRWAQMCAVAPGKSGAVVSGVTISPALEGEWRWDSPNSMRFIPKKSWAPSTTYTVDLSKLTLPSRARLSQKTVSSTRWEQGAIVEKGRMWIDPRPNGERVATFDVRFSHIPDKAAIERDTVAVGTEGVRLGQTQFVWSNNDSRCLIKVPVLRLPAKEGTVKLEIRDVKRLVKEENNSITIHHGVLAGQSVAVKPESELFSISATLEAERGTNLDQEYVLTVTSSLLVRPDALQKMLTVVELPAKLQDEALRPYQWSNAPRITPEDVQKGRVLTLQPLQAAQSPTTKVRFRVPVEAGRYILCQLKPGADTQANPAPRSTAPTWQAVYHAATGEPTVDFLQPGNVLRLNADARLDVVGTGLKNVKWRAYCVLPAFFGKVASQSDLFAARGDFDDADSMSVTASGEINLPPAKDALSAQFASLDLSEVLKKSRGLVYMELIGESAATNPNGSPKSRVYSQRMLQLTPWGIVAKDAADGARDIFVCDLNTGKPVANAKVQILGRNGLSVFDASTNADGKAAIQPLNGLERERTPSAVLVQGGDSATGEVAWLSLNDWGNRQEYSRFNVGGMQSSADGVNAYVFAQRGMFRPGETLHFGAIVRRSDWQKLPDNLPLTVRVMDPAETLLQEQPVTLSPQGLLTFDYATNENAPTGRYRAEVRSGSQTLGSCVVRVEEFQPDTLAMQVTMPPALGKGWLYVNPKQKTDSVIAVQLRNLFGTPATHNDIRGVLSAKPKPMTFTGFEEYTFSDITVRKDAEDIELTAKVTTNEQGEASLPFALQEVNGTMQVRVLVEGFEANGGRAVTQSRTFMVSTLARVMGYKPSGPGTNLNFLPQGVKTAVDFITLDSNLAQVNPGELSFTVSQRSYVKALVAGEDGRYSYQEMPVDSKLHEAAVTPQQDGSCSWEVPTDASGDFLLTVRDKAGELMASVPFTVAGNDNLLPLQTSLGFANLRVRCDKTDYAQGDTVQMMFSAPYDGMALITLERDKVWAHQFVPVKAGNSVHSLTLPQNFEGRGYVNVALVRSKDSSEIFMDPYAVAVVPLTVNVQKRDLGLKIEAAQLNAPGGTLVAKVTAKEQGDVVIFAVDEGVLQLTNFVTPKPLHYLLVDRALEVSTRHMLNRIMPDHGQLAQRIPAFGGGMNMLGGAFHNPFKRRGEPPLAYWSSVVSVSPQGTEIRVPLPQWYSGTVRLMAVGASAELAGNTEAQGVVRGDVTLVPQLPFNVAPTDTFNGAVMLSNNTDASMTLDLVCDAGKLLTLQGDATQKITIDAHKEQLVPLNFTVGGTPGAGTVQLTARLPNGSEVKRDSGISVRPASMWEQTMLSGRLAAAGGGQDTLTQSVTLMQRRPLLSLADVSGENTALEAETSFSIALTPLPALRGLVRSLREYPYGCTEQLLSRGLAAAVLRGNPAIAKAVDGKRAAKMQEKDNASVAQAMQAAQASFSYGNGLRVWMDDYNAGDDAETLLRTAYGADVLLTAQEAGFTVPGDLLSRLMQTLENKCDGSNKGLEYARAQAYALWMLTRAGYITAPAIERLLPDFNTIEGWRSDITGLLIAGCYATMHMDNEARELAGQYRLPGANFVCSYPMDDLASQALAVSVMAHDFPQLLQNMGDDLGQSLVEACNGGMPSTFSAALGARALVQLAGGAAAAQADNMQGVGLRCVSMHKGFATLPAGEDTVMWSDASSGMLSLEAPGCARAEIVNNDGVSMPTLYYEVSAAGYTAGAQNRKAVQNGMEVARTWLDEDGKPVTTVRQGQVLTVKVTASVYGNDSMSVVLCDILPGGFAFELERSEDGETSSGGGRQERREDRMLIFATLNKQPSTFEYKVRATQTGDFVVPAMHGEAMYNPAVHANGAEGRVKVQ